MKCFFYQRVVSEEKKLNEAIEKCGELSHRNVEISAPHPYETLSDLKNIFHEFVQNDYKFVFHNYFPTPKKSLFKYSLFRQKDYRGLAKKCVSQ